MDDNDAVDVGALGRFLTIADTAEVLNISVSQTYALVRSGELPAIKIGAGGHWRIERTVLESYIEAMSKNRVARAYGTSLTTRT